ncbi:MAG: hypothetical protein IPH16_21265, partial [Haliscomenobacter sp.]|nr:hypothetical protein [Haliscomenobacter sp.]
MSDIKQFDYEGTPISFEFSDGNKMINATEMARPFRKQIGHFLAFKERGIIFCLSPDIGIPI